MASQTSPHPLQLSHSYKYLWGVILIGSDIAWVQLFLYIRAAAYFVINVSCIDLPGFSLCTQKGDIILKINDIPILGKLHSEAIQMIRGVMAASTIRMELIQGDQTDLSPDWGKWVEKYELSQSETHR